MGRDATREICPLGKWTGDGNDGGEKLFPTRRIPDYQLEEFRLLPGIVAASWAKLGDDYGLRKYSLIAAGKLLRRHHDRGVVRPQRR